ncbi:hypothetical protein [Caballeronia glebae]|uniref:hypothetical protein n=1 Tax=Caballeronia glebae TaxID=1777143 RepID=UPI0038BE0B89
MLTFSDNPAIDAAAKRAMQHLRVPPELLDEPLAQECPPTEGATRPELCPSPALNS